MKQAQIRVLVSDASDPASVRDATRMLDEILSASGDAPTNSDEGESTQTAGTTSKTFFIRNKSDMLTTSVVSSASESNLKLPSTTVFEVSCTTGDGINNLESALGQAALELLQPASGEASNDSNGATESAVITRDRHRSHVKRCVRHLDEFIEAGLPMDAAAEELRYATTTTTITSYLRSVTTSY